MKKQETKKNPKSPTVQADAPAPQAENVQPGLRPFLEQIVTLSRERGWPQKTLERIHAIASEALATL